MNLKEIHIGKHIYEKVVELDIPVSRVCKFMNCEEEDLEKIYNNPNIETQNLLKWSKLLKYDFFRLYVGHLILYAPVSKHKSYQNNSNLSKSENTALSFKKNIYTQEIKDFILKKISTHQMSINVVCSTYNIPKSTLNKWIKKQI